MWLLTPYVPTATLQAVPGGRAGVLTTVRTMRELVNRFKTDPELLSRARSIVQFLPAYDYAGEVRAVFEYVRDRIRYIRDVHGVETLADPVTTLKIGQGDCDDKATLLAAMLEAIGTPTRFVMGQYSSNDFEHVYVQAWVSDRAGGEWVSADATQAQPLGWEAPAVNYWHEKV